MALKYRTYYHLLFVVIALLAFVEVKAQTNPTNYRDDLNEYHESHNSYYKALNQQQTKKEPSKRTLTQTPNLYNFHCKDLWLSGTNLAWDQFGGDIGYSNNPDITYFNQFFQNMKAAGGNSVRWWLHTDATWTPQINTNGTCPGLSHQFTNAEIIAQVKSVLDAAQANDITVDICLFSFDMLQDATNKGWADIDAEGNKNFLTSAANVQTYIDNALLPMVNALKGHPALLCWEVFNEPEGMSNEFGWTGNQGGEFIDMADIQMVVNKIAGAIHRADPNAAVTNGAWSFRALSDNITGTNNMNYYRDDRLIAAGGDQDGTLDFYQVHYYSWAGTALSPFHHDVDYWGLDKPVMVAEYHVEETFGVPANELYEELIHRGYFGGWGWQYNETDLWNAIQPAMANIHTEHASLIDIDLGSNCTTTPTGQGLAACHSKFLGNIMPSSWQGEVIRSDWGTYWNQVSPENAGKWGVVEGTRDNYNWTDLDLMYEYAQTNNIPFKQHVFVWGSQQPNWMAALSTTEQLEEIEEWYALFAQRYPNTEIIDVVNESIREHAPPIDFINAIGGNNNGANQPYLAANASEYGPYNTGWDYIIYSFAKAREYFPNAQLVLNDYGIISDPSAITEHLEIVNILKDRGLIDAVGVQCHHFNMNNLSAANLKNNLDQLATAGLPIHITELDMTGTETEQRDRYAEKFPVFWEHPAVEGVTIWGYVEGQTWEDGSGLLNADGSEKAAMAWLKDYMDCNSIPNSPPTISITSPTASSLSNTTELTITVNATDDGAIENIEYFVNGSTIGSNTGPSIIWTDITSGSYELTAIATDNLGLKTTSASVAIQVENCAVLTTSNDSACGSGTVSLSVNGGSGNYSWFETNTSTTAVANGQLFETEITESSTYYVIDSENLTTATTLNIGEPATLAGTTIWQIDDFETGDKQYKLTIEKTVTLEALSVYPGNNNTNVTVRILQNNNVVAERSVANASNTKTVIDFNIKLTPGEYILDAVGTSNTLGYGSEGGSFPYSINGIATYTGNASWVIADGRYGLFYDISLIDSVESTCSRYPVLAAANPIPSDLQISDQNNLSCYKEEGVFTVTNTLESTYNWNIDNGSIANGQGTNTVSVNLNQVDALLSVIETNKFGCSGNEATYDLNACLITGESGVIDNLISIYPNPATNSIHVSGIATHTPWKLVNTLSQLCSSGSGNEVNIEKMENGIYFLLIGQKQYKIIKQ